ncbi:MAG: hypothetical protein SVO01_10070, partial [Thermotogota bacterium]|nr:hypothetical protein [Thermotogota bacterium]
LLYTFILSVNKFKYEQWANEHKYLMEAMLTFRIGPIIFAHPGKKADIKIKGKDRPNPISIWDMQHGLLQKEDMLWFNLIHNPITIQAERDCLTDERSKYGWKLHLVK